MSMIGRIFDFVDEIFHGRKDDVCKEEVRIMVNMTSDISSLSEAILAKELQNEKARHLRGKEFAEKLGLCIVALLIHATALADATLSNVSAQQRYPWNGLVDLRFSISGDKTIQYNTKLEMFDQAGGTNINMRTVSKSDGTDANTHQEFLKPANYHWVWNAEEDLPENFVSDKIIFNVTCKDIDSSPVTSGLQVHWRLNANGVDSSGKGLNLSGNTVTYITDRFGRSDSAAYFNGATNYSLNSSIAASGSLSISFWAKPEKNGHNITSSDVGYGNLISYSENYPMIILPTPTGKNKFPNHNGYYIPKGELGIAVGMNGIDIFAHSNTDATFGGSGNFCCYFSKRSLSLGGSWHHIVVTINNNGAPQVYLDGNKLAGYAAAFEKTDNVHITPNLNLGGRNPSKYPNGSDSYYTSDHAYKGGLDDFMVFNRVLTAAEIKSLYDAGK